MIHISNPLDVRCNYDFSKNFNIEKILFFDIETTGLSAEISSLYLIGCIYFSFGTFHLDQWFADDYQEEQTLLTSFFDFCKNFDILIHYNGNGFDLPFLKKKSSQLNLTYPLEDMQSLDLYRRLSPYKKLLSTTNIKQKTVEELTGLHRKDPFNGGELIKVYGQYLHGKLMQEKNFEDFLPPLLLHNKEDLTGLLWITSILSFTEDFFECQPIVTKCLIEDSVLTAFLTFPMKLPFSIQFSQKDFYFSAEQDFGNLQIPIIENRIKFFYEDYKNYYYLPQEDSAIHKSVASFVDKEHKKKATKDTCYSWIETNSAFLKNTAKQTVYFQQLIAHYIKSNK